MKIKNRETKNLFASFLTGMALVVVLGSMVALSTSAFAMGGGGGGGGPAPAPKVTKVDDPVAKPGDEVAEVKKPVVEPGNGVPDGETPIGKSRTKEPEEKTLAIEDPDESKTETKPDERKVDFSKPEVVEATVGFAASTSSLAEGGGHLRLEVRSGVLSQPLTLDVVVGGTAYQGTDYTISSTSLTIPAGTASAFLTLTGIDDAVYETGETITLVLKGRLPDGMKFGKRTHIVTIVDDEIEVVETTTVDFVIPFSQVEKGATGNLQVTLSNPLPQPLTLTLSEGGSGDGGGNIIDFSSDVLTFQPGETSKAVSFTVRDTGNRYESTIIFLGGNLPEGVRLGVHNAHLVTILDTDNLPTTEVDEKPGKENSKVVVKPDDGAEDKTVNKPDERKIDFPEDEDTKDETGTDAEDGTPRVVYIHKVKREEGRLLIENLGIVDQNITGRHRDSGDISIKNATQGTVGWGIHARATGSSEHDNNILIENRGTVGWNITAKHRRRKEGDTSIVNHGTVGWGMHATHRGSGDTSIVNHGAVGWGMHNTHHGSGDASVINHGTVGSMYATHNGSGDILIENAAQGIVGWMDATINSWSSGNNQISIINHGDVGRSMYATHRGRREVDTSIVNHGTVGRDIRVRYDSRESIGDISIANYGTVGSGIYATHRGESGIVRFEGNISDGSLRGRTIHLGDVDFRGNGEGNPGTLDIMGNYEGSSGKRLKFHVGSNGQDYGRLTIDGNVKGQSKASLVLDDETAITNTPVLIKVDGEAQADNFVGEETIGAFHYILEHDSDDLHTWRFVREGFSDAADQSSRIPNDIIDNIAASTRLNPDKRDGEEWHLWGEQIGSHTVLGFDVPVAKLMGGNMFVGTSVAQNFSTSNNISVDSQVTALAANWERGGLYVGAQTRFARFISDVSTNRLSVVQNNEGTGINMSMETGYRLNMMNFQIVPQAQLTWTRVGFDDFVGPHGELVSLEDGDRATGRLGLSWDGGWQGAEGFGRFYGGMSLRGNLDGKTSVNVSGVSIANEQKGLSVDGKLGLSYEWDEGYAVHGEVSALRNDDAEEVRADLGIRINF